MITVKTESAINTPTEWCSTWQSEGYTKLWVIYNAAHAEEE